MELRQLTDKAKAMLSNIRLPKFGKKQTESGGRWSDVDWIKKLFTLSIFLLLLVVLALFGLHQTSSSAYCASCHEMTPEAHTLAASSHAKVDCVACHTGPGIKNSFKAKGQRVEEIFKKVTKTSEQPIKMRVPIPDQNCEQCHNMLSRKVSAKGDLVIPHDQHKDKDISCVTCHSGVAHGKVQERGLTATEMYQSWTEKMATNTMADKKFVSPQMETCMTCHEGREVATTCQTCHETGMYPESHKAADFKDKLHGNLAKEDLDSCNSCHKYMSETEITAIDAGAAHLKYLEGEEATETTVDPKLYIEQNDFCRSCHSTKPESHSDDFFQSHGVLASQDKASCLSCHEETRTTPNPITKTTCGSCHTSSHEDYNWRTQHPRTSSPPTKLEASCYSCHTKSTCQTCHRDQL